MKSSYKSYSETSYVMKLQGLQWNYKITKSVKDKSITFSPGKDLLEIIL